GDLGPVERYERVVLDARGERVGRRVAVLGIGRVPHVDGEVAARAVGVGDHHGLAADAVGAGLGVVHHGAPSVVVGVLAVVGHGGGGGVDVVGRRGLGRVAGGRDGAVVVTAGGE